MKRIIPLIFICLLLASFSQAQFSRYIIKFRNKGNNPYSLANPSAFLSQRSVERRTRYNIPVDSIDLPVTPSYIAQVAAIPNVTVLNISKWLNYISIQTTDANAINSINSLPFVQSVSGIAARTMNANSNRSIEDESIKFTNTNSAKVQQAEGENHYDYGVNSANEIHLHHGEFLHNIGLRGETMQIAMIDAGFLNYTTLDAFDSINANGQVLDTWDFVARNASVVEDYVHGMACLSTIAANIPGQFVGMAPKSSFYLYRSEDISSEYPIEEFNWVCGAERADSSGADVISSSLGYTTFDTALLSHTYADMNGHTTMSSIAAGIAAKKALLVFLAAGNEGNNTWHYIMTPADADSVLTVGAVDTTSKKGSFSSWGPTADGRIKPDVVSVGLTAVIETSGNYAGISQGTSYACPKMAGLGTCLWQAFPEFNNMKIVNAIKQSGNAASHPTDSLGYGIPDMRLAFTKLLVDFATSQIAVDSCTATISWTSKDVGNMRYQIERKTTSDPDYTKIGELSAQAGTTLSNHSYQFSNSLSGINAGTVSYRIRQIVDSSAEGVTSVYIDTSSASTAIDCSETSPPPPETKDYITVSPNPVLDEIKVIVQTSIAIPSMVIEIYDMQGRLMDLIKETKNPGRAVFTIPSGKLAKGKYTITVYDKRKIIGTVKIVKL